MHEADQLTFDALEQRELLKAPTWWLGFAAAVFTAAYVYCEKTLD